MQKPIKMLNKKTEKVLKYFKNTVFIPREQKMEHGINDESFSQ